MHERPGPGLGPTPTNLVSENSSRANRKLLKKNWVRIGAPEKMGRNGGNRSRPPPTRIGGLVGGCPSPTHHASISWRGHGCPQVFARALVGRWAACDDEDEDMEDVASSAWGCWGGGSAPNSSGLAGCGDGGG